MPRTNEPRRFLPSVDRVLGTEAAAVALRRFQRAYVTETVRAVLDETRARLAAGETDVTVSADEVMAAALKRMEKGETLRLRPLVNATGVVLHTNLGRAVLAPEAVEAVTAVARQASNLEYDLSRGERGERDALVRGDLCALTGAEAATVVNNNAAAVLLCLNTMAQGREVVVSRGELIEIGGSFRIPDVMAKSNVRLREVGTTNRTHPRDYGNAISEHTALLLKVHTSNYRIVGFTSEVELRDLVALGREHRIPVMEDLGSGALIDLSAYGLPREPVVAERIATGADVVTFSGDKLFGGPQAGFIVGRREIVQRINRNPLKRVLRCDKMTLAALAATLRLYRSAPDLRQALPTLRCLTRPQEELEATGRTAVQLLGKHLGTEFAVELIDAEAEIGSGALPVKTLPSKAVSITHTTQGPQEIACRFREADPPIIGRVHSGRFLLDLRCIFDAEELVPRMGVFRCRRRLTVSSDRTGSRAAR
jgi:L-seryl-tRNA(Ser) seleniumtransferase